MAGKSQNPCHMTGEFHGSISETLLVASVAISVANTDQSML